jgi:cytochrome c oxidase cbb3-type subunit IV
VGELYGLIKSFWLLVAVLVFAGIAAWVYWPSRKRSLEAQARIPLDDDTEER